MPIRGLLILTLLMVCSTFVDTTSRRVSAQDELQAALALESALIKVIEESDASVVSIARIVRNSAPEPPVRLNPFGRNRQEREERDRRNPESSEFQPNEFGAGVILAPRDNPNSRYLLTNYHVVKGGPISGQNNANADADLYVKLKGGNGYYATIKAADPRSDLAVLDIDYDRMQLRPTDLKPLKVAENLKVKKGQIVIGLGNPYAIARDGSASASWGMISNLSRHPEVPPEPETATVRPDETLHHTGTLLQVDMKLNLGTSGGALINLRGEFVGLTTSLAALEGFEASSGFAIPATSEFLRIFETLARGEEVEYGFLGVNPEDISPREFNARNLSLGQTSAPILASVFHNTPADQAGLRRRDLVLSIQGRTVLNKRDLMREISLLGPDSIARMKIWRPELTKPQTVMVELGKWPVVNDEEIIVTKPRYPQWRGMMVDYPTGRSRFINRTLNYPDAVLVRDIHPDSPAAKAGLQTGEYVSFVENQPVTRPAEFYQAIGSLNGEVSLRMVDGRVVTIPAPLPESSPNP